MRIKLSLFLLLILAVSAGYAQDAAFSQYYGNPNYLNPALAGSKIMPRLTLNYRNQWPAIPSTFVTYSASYDQFFDEISGGVGLIVMNDNQGDGTISSTSVGAIYSFRLNITREMTLNAGFQTSYIQNKLNWDKFIFGDQLQWGNLENLPPTAESPPDRMNFGMIDFSTGLLFGYKQSMYFGLAAHHINQPNNSFTSINDSRLDMKITAHAGALLDLRQGLEGGDIEDMSISPNILYQQQGKFHQLNIGVSFNIYPMVIGAWFRNNFESSDAIIGLIGFQYEKMKVGYSYDYTISSLTNSVTHGAHEISFAWIFDRRQKTFKHRAIKSPMF
ncbi:MAG: PorP/SprF family type IX secretion system membrane protein [Lentimicrobium sp.]|jgi:type IX secretion system PorP/SprF family membrane protein|nr:PorP/SprF family type IX secretion system membrane protein [Lentimicrobium sp.]